MGLEMCPIRRSWIQGRLGSLRGHRRSLEDTRDRLDTELERLREARDSITNELSDHSSFRSEVRHAISLIERSRFRGDTRNQMSERLVTMRDYLIKSRDHHQGNRNQVREKITAHQSSRTQTINRLAIVNNEIVALEQELATGIRTIW